MVDGEEKIKGTLSEIAEHTGLKEITIQMYATPRHVKKYESGKVKNAVYRNGKKGKKLSVYDIYINGEVIATGTAIELAEELGLSRSSIWKYATTDHKNKNEGRDDVMIAWKKKDHLHRELVDMEHCNHCKARINRIYQGYFCPVCLTEYNDYGEELEPIY